MLVYEDFLLELGVYSDVEVDCGLTSNHSVTPVLGRFGTGLRTGYLLHSIIYTNKIR